MHKQHPPIVSVIGQSGSGKTTFLARLIAELKSRGYRVAVIKHHNHTGVEIDRPGKDTWHHFQAGADVVMMATPDKLATYRRLTRDLTPDELAHLLPGPVDIVLTEGYKTAGKPAIEVLRAGHSTELVGRAGQWIALVMDAPIPWLAAGASRQAPAELPRFLLADAQGVADLLERRFSLVPAGPDAAQSAGR